MSRWFVDRYLCKDHVDQCREFEVLPFKRGGQRAAISAGRSPLDISSAFQISIDVDVVAVAVVDSNRKRDCFTIQAGFVASPRHPPANPRQSRDVGAVVEEICAT